MTADNGVACCDFCKKGHLTWRLEKMAFWQSSDKGYVHCRVTLAIGVCDTCGSQTLEPQSDRIFEAAFQQEYNKLP